MLRIFLLILLIWPNAAMAKVLDLSMRPKQPIEQRLDLPTEKWIRKEKVQVKKTKIIKAKSSKILPFVLLPMALPLHTLIHEGSHAVAAEMLGYGVTGFYPYPHLHEDKFYFGRITIDKESPGGTEQIVFSLAPHMVDIFMFSFSDILLSTEIVDIKDTTGIVLYIFGIVAPVIDFSVGYLEGSDWDKARRVSDKTSITLNIVGAAVMAVGIYRALTHTVRLFK